MGCPVTLILRSLNLMKILCGFCLLVPFFTFAGDVPTAPLLEKGALLASDDFERSDLGEWKVVIPTFTVESGALKSVQKLDEHRTRAF